MNKSPLRYPGGKTRACKKLDLIFSKHFNTNKYSVIVSPFFGGGSFEFYIQNKYKYSIRANDGFMPLANFWNLCKNNKEELCMQLSQYFDTEGISIVTKEDFYNFRNQIMDEEDELTKGVYYFIINRCSFSGATLSGGFSQEASKKRFTKSSVARIQALDLTNSTFANQDFQTFLGTEDPPEIFTFLDPPYYLEKNSKLYGKGGDMHKGFDHKKLYEILQNKTDWLMTYNDCPFIRDLYKDFTILEEDWTYGMNKSKKSSEIVIIHLKK